jgi:predicted dehydrogenase
MAKVKFGLVGCGDVSSHTYLPGIVTFDNVDLVAVCDVVPERAQWAKETFGAKESYTDVDEMLQNADIEAVVDLTPIAEHAAINIKVLQASKHLYTEKSMATTMEEADAIIAEAQRAGVKLACAAPVMLSPLNQKVKELIDSGVIGKVAFARMHSSHFGASEFTGYGSDPTWFFKPGGGPILDMGVYAVHTLTGLLGPAKRITAMSGISVPERLVRSGPAKGKIIQVEEDDNTQILLDFGDATFGIIDATFCVHATKGPRAEFYGSLGVLNINGSGVEAPVELYLVDREHDVKGWIAPELDTPRGVRWTIARGVEHLAECILEDKAPLISGEHARHALEIMTKAREAARLGQTLDINTTFDWTS